MCLIADSVSIFDSDFHDIDPAKRRDATLRANSDGLVASVKIGNNVWIGTRVLIGKGVSVGDDTVIGAGSVVVTSLPPNVLAAGVPARVIRAL